MKIIIRVLLFILVLGWSHSAANAQNFLFKHPRGGGFKVKQHDVLDFSNTQHFIGSGILSVGFHRLLQKTDIKHPKIAAGIMASVVGFLKELEDGYREGWGWKDVLANEIGIIGFLFASSATHYTVTIKQVVMGPNDFGIGVRFFRSSDITPLKASIGVYTIRDNHHRTWVGLDSHFSIYKNAELHFGVSMIDLRNANRFHFRPNFGIGFRFY